MNYKEQREGGISEKINSYIMSAVKVSLAGQISMLYDSVMVLLSKVGLIT